MRTLLALLGVPLLLLSLASAFFEARPQLAHARNPGERVAALVEIGSDPQPVSIFDSRVARRTQIVDCIETLRVVMAADVDEKIRQSLQKACLRIAESIVARDRYSSNDWFLAAGFAELGHDDEKAREYLLQSFRSGPNEQWIAERRALFAYRIRDRLDPQLLDHLDKDFLLLLRTELGVQALAREFVNDPALREHLTTLAETLPPAFQSRFLYEVRRAASEPSDVDF